MTAMPRHRHGLPVAIRVPREQPVRTRADPQQAIARAGDLPDAGARQRHGAIARHTLDHAPISGDLHQPLRGGRQPQPILGIHMQRAQVDIGQPLLAPPRTEAMAIKAQQAIIAGEPQIAVTVLDDGAQRRGRQRVRRPQRTRPRQGDQGTGEGWHRQPEHDPQHQRDPTPAHPCGSASCHTYPDHPPLPEQHGMSTPREAEQ
ncbi:hypothetical protein PV767_04540 [Stenotrophomonas rhizophila]